MKRFIRVTIFVILLGTLPLFTTHVFADDPPNPGGGPGGGDLPVGGGTPVGSGLILLLSFGAGYSIKKIYYVNKDLEK